MTEKKKLLVVAVFAATMALVEAAVVVYLRTLIGRIEPYQPNPLPNFAGLGEIEVVREAATLVMLALIGVLAGKTLLTRFAYAAITFGVWDILYYVYLVPMSGWPRSIFDWDILFLLPLPWWGPVLAPVSIAILVTVGGVFVTQTNSSPRSAAWLLSLIGALIALITFMADAILIAPQGAEAIRTVLPSQFNWHLFILAWTLMAIPVLDMTKQSFGKARSILSGAKPSQRILSQRFERLS
jgi:hypothetical protein